MLVVRTNSHFFSLSEFALESLKSYLRSVIQTAYELPRTTPEITLPDILQSLELGKLNQRKSNTLYTSEAYLDENYCVTRNINCCSDSESELE
jgi:hypothetical protein